MSDTDYFPLPVTTDEITSEWLTAAIRQRAPEATVLGCRIVDEIRGTCSKIRLRLDLDQRATTAGIPELVILKGGFEAHSRELCYMHEREVRSYRDVLREIPLPSPRCYFADYDPERQQGIIIMEDLAAAGATFCHALKPQSFEQVARRLQVLARYHAATWDSPELAPGGKWGDLVDFLDTVDRFFAQKTSPEDWQRFLHSPRGVASSVRFQSRDWMLEAWRRLKHFTKQQTYCLLHGDIHLGNLYIDSNDEPGFFDPLASRGPGLLEVAYHIAASVDSGDRRRWEGPLVQHYLDEVKRCGAATPPFDDAMHQYAIFQVYGYFIWMTTESRYQTELVNTANIARVSATMLDHNTFELLQSLDSR